MKKVVASLISIILAISVFALPAFAVGGSGTDSLVCPKCGSSLNVSAIESGLYLKYSYVCSNSSCDYKREEQKYFWGDSVKGSSAEPVLKKFVPGGGSSEGGGVGRRPSGYVDDTGTPSFNVDGNLIFYAPITGWGMDSSARAYDIDYPHLHNSYNDGQHVTGTFPLRSGVTSTRYFTAIAYFTAPISGKYYLYNGDVVGLVKSPDFASYKAVVSWSSSSYVRLSKGDKKVAYCSCGFLDRKNSDSTYEAIGYGFHLIVVPDEIAVNKQTNITINNNTWNGNIYVDNSTNLTYIYPQYTTINENNETVTNISNNPIIYNNTTNEYYTYDSVTNNYYYITYVTETPTPTPEPDATPSPSPTPAPDPTPTPDPGTDPTPTPTPGTDPTPTPTPGGDTGDTTGILAILTEIKDNMIQGFADIKATVVQGWADFTTNFNTTLGDLSASFKATIGDLSANFSAAIENLNINIQNFFNKKFPDESEPTPTPSLSPAPTPLPTSSPSIDPILPDTQNYIIPKMNSNTFTDEHGTWIASGSSKYSDVFDYFRAFDRSAEIWETNVSPSNLQIEIPDPESYYVDGYIMRVSKFTNRYPKDWTLQGSDDGKTWNDLDTQAGQDLSDQTEHKYSLSLHKAYKYYRLNMSNYASAFVSLSHFNLLGYDAEDVVTPTPTPAPTETPTPTQSPGSKPSGDTNNFWNFVFPGSDDGTDNGHKGILWALISLLIAVVTFVLGLGSAYTYVFPFLPSGLVTTIHICVLVLLLFAIIKFVRSFL